MDVDHSVPICAHCDNPGVEKCNGCDAIHYCSEACQAADWETHTFECNVYKSDEWRYKVKVAGSDALPHLVQAPAALAAEGVRIGMDTAGRTRGDVRVLSWDMGNKDNDHDVKGWMDMKNPQGAAWRSYIAKMAAGHALPHLFVVSLQAVARKNGLPAALHAFLEEETGDKWRYVQAYDKSLVRAFSAIYQTQQIVYWRPRTTGVWILKKATTCFAIGLNLGVRCANSAAGIYLNYQVIGKGTAPVPLAAISVHFPYKKKARKRAYNMLMNRLVPRLIDAKTPAAPIRLTLDCVTLIVSGDMGFRKKNNPDGSTPKRDPLTFARLSKKGPFPPENWAEVGQPASTKTPLPLTFVPPYRATCPMNTEKTFEAYFHNSVVEARRAGDVDAFDPKFPPSHCDRVLVRFPTNVWDQLVERWTAFLEIDGALRSDHEALTVDMQLSLVSVCTSSQIAISLISGFAAATQPNTMFKPGEWYDPMAVQMAKAAFVDSEIGAELPAVPAEWHAPVAPAVADQSAVAGLVWDTGAGTGDDDVEDLKLMYDLVENAMVTSNILKLRISTSPQKRENTYWKILRLKTHRELIPILKTATATLDQWVNNAPLQVHRGIRIFTGARWTREALVSDAVETVSIIYRIYYNYLSYSRYRAVRPSDLYYKMDFISITDAEIVTSNLNAAFDAVNELMPDQ